MSAAHTPGPWGVGGTFLPGTPDAHCSIWGATPPGCQSGDRVAQRVHPKDAVLIAKAPIAPKLAVALRAVVHVLVTCDAETNYGDQEQCSNQQWDAALAAARAALAEWDAQ